MRKPAALARIAVVVCAGVIAFALANHDGPQDFEQTWFAARLLVAGRDPYPAIGPGRERDQRWSLLYPGPALVVATPFTLLDARPARVTFAVVGAVLFAVGLTREGWSGVPFLLSYPFLNALSLAQWTPWLAAAMMFPWLGFVAAAKPNVGVAALAGANSRRQLATMVLACVIVTAVSLVWLPSWPRSWYEATKHAPANVPLVTILPIGPVLAVALLRWRDPAARMLAALAIVPQNPVPNGAVPLYAMPWRWWEATILTISSWLTVPWVFHGGMVYRTYDAYAARMGPATVACVYLPIAVLLLCRTGERPRSQRDEVGTAASRCRHRILATVDLKRVLRDEP